MLFDTSLLTTTSTTASPLRCNHGTYNTTTQACDCELGWATDANQDALSGVIEYCGIQGSTMGPNDGKPSASGISTQSVIIICAAVGGGVLLLVLFVVCCCCRRRRRAQQKRACAEEAQRRTETLLTLLARPPAGEPARPSTEETTDVVHRVLRSVGLLNGTPASPSPSSQSAFSPSTYGVPAQSLRDPALVSRLTARDAAAQYTSTFQTDAFPSCFERQPVLALDPAALEQAGVWYNGVAGDPYDGLDNAPYGRVAGGDLDHYYYGDATGHIAPDEQAFAYHYHGAAYSQCVNESRRASNEPFTPFSNTHVNLHAPARRLLAAEPYWDDEPAAPRHPAGRASAYVCENSVDSSQGMMPAVSRADTNAFAASLSASLPPPAESASLTSHCMPTPGDDTRYTSSRG